MEVTRKTFIGEVKSIDEKNFTVTAVMSDESVDRYKEVILVDAWKKGLKDFMQHPVLLSSHDYYSGLLSQIGEWEKVWIDKDTKQLVGRAKYYVNKGNPEADWGFFLATQGIAAYSVGFISKGIETDEEKMAELVGTKKKPRAVFTDVELLETSQVLLPANPAALQQDNFLPPEEDDENSKAFTQMFVQKMTNTQFKEKVREFIKEKPIEEEKEVTTVIEETKRNLEEEFDFLKALIDERERNWEVKYNGLLDSLNVTKDELVSVKEKLDTLEKALDAETAKELDLEVTGDGYVEKLFEEEKEVDLKAILNELQGIKKIVFGS